LMSSKFQHKCANVTGKIRTGKGKGRNAAEKCNLSVVVPLGNEREGEKEKNEKRKERKGFFVISQGEKRKWKEKKAKKKKKGGRKEGGKRRGGRAGQ